jgi:hypothetical protein
MQEPRRSPFRLIALGNEFLRAASGPSGTDRVHALAPAGPEKMPVKVQERGAWSSRGQCGTTA